MLNPEPWHWAVFGVVLMLFELVIPTFAALWFGFAGLLVGILLWLMPSLSFTAQLFIWSILSIACTVAWFKWIKPLATDKTNAGLSRESTIGQVGMVIALGDNHITVRFSIPVLGSDEWQCRSTYDLQVGDRVQVIDILGNDFLVKPYSTQNPSS